MRTAHKYMRCEEYFHRSVVVVEEQVNFDLVIANELHNSVQQLELRRCSVRIQRAKQNSNSLDANRWLSSQFSYQHLSRQCQKHIDI